MTPIRHSTSYHAVRLATGHVPKMASVTRRELRGDEVRLAVAYTGLCHTDLHFIDSQRTARMADEITLGHEVSGTVIEVGSEVERWRRGDEVVVNPLRAQRRDLGRVLDVIATC